MNKKGYKLLLLTTSIFSTTLVYGHANTVPNNTLDTFNGRQYQEGSTAFIKINLSHGCKNSTGEALATKHTTAIFPNSVDLSGITYTADRKGNHYSGNALMGIKPAVDSNWESIQRLKGSVPAYYNHGSKSTDTRAVHWIDGYVADDMYANLEFKAKLPKLSGCYSKLRVFIPVVQYCTNEVKKAWLREATPSFNSDIISAGYAPYIDVIRDTKNNPYPAECSGHKEAEAYPSVDAIEAFLPLKPEDLLDD